MTRLRFRIAVILVLFLGAALRFHRLDHQSFWNDEGNSARLSERSLSLIIEGTASDIHPPLYYLALHGWRKFAGDSEFGLRSLSAYLGLGLVAVIIAWGRKAARRYSNPALVAGLLAAINPALIYYSQEARMYEMLAFFAGLAGLLLASQLRNAFASRVQFFAFLLTAAAGLYTHYFYPVVLLVDNLAVGARLARLLRRVSGPAAGRYVRPWLLTMAGILLLYLPWLPIFIRQASGRTGSTVPIQRFLKDAAVWLAAGPTLNGEAALLPLFGLASLVVLGLLLRRKDGGHQLPLRFIFAAGLVVPVLFMGLAGTTRPAYFKFLLVAVAPMSLLAGRGLWATWGLLSYGTWSLITKVVALVPLAAILFGSALSLNNMYFDTAYARDDYRGLAARITAENHPNAAIVLNAANQWEVFTYYYDGAAPVVPLPVGYPDPAEIDRQLTDLAAEYERIYLLLWGEGERDPNRLVQRWLDAEAFKARDEWVGDVRFLTYAVDGTPAEGMATELNLKFGPDITLLGYSLGTPMVRPGDIFPLTLFWQTDRPLDRRYKVFLHVVDDSGSLVAQRDSEPGGGLAITTTWEPGQTQVDNHGLLLPFDLPSGTYTVQLGLYELGDPVKRLVISPVEGTKDSWPLTTVQIVDR